jgi:Reverse transcriptase (RNA-dependent DNA polymerase)
VFVLDFSKAFDTVRYSTLLDKLARLDIPDEAFNWIKNFLEVHSHCTKYAGLVSTLINISASVIQGSAIEPASYVVVASDLRPVTQGNLLFKFADDTFLVVLSVNTGTCEEEIAHVRDWACTNNLTLNHSKSQELLVITPGVRGAGMRLNPPPTIE